jgi:hypothetical protein
MSAYIERIESPQINDIILHHKLLEKQKQAKLKIIRREIIQIKAKINKIETKKHTKNQRNKKLVL